MATIYQCMYRGTASPTAACGDMNQGKRPKCRGCKSTIRAIVGEAVLVHWRGDGRYTAAEAVRSFTTLLAADKAASKAYELDNESTLVSRFITP